MKKFLLLIVVVFFIQPGISQDTDGSILTIDRIFKDKEFRLEKFGSTRFIDNGKSYTTLEASETVEEAEDIVVYDTESGKREILISAELLIPQGDTTALEISDYEWSADKNMLLIFTNTKRVWRYNTRGDYWVLNLRTKNLLKLGGNAPESSLMFTKFSPDNKKVAYASEHNVFVQDLSNWKTTQLTFDGSTTIINGTFDWVYEEEFDCRDGFRWSPDSKYISYWQLDASLIREFLLINTTDSVYSYTIPVQYPKVGTINSACRVGVVNANGGETVWMKVPGDTRNDYYIPRMDWPQTSNEIYIQRINRTQNKLEVMLCDIKNGEVNTILTETDDAWIDINDDMHWFNNGRNFTWLSERDGWRHMYFISRDGKDQKLITPGNFDVIQVSSVDFINGWIYYLASPNNATQSYLFRASLEGIGKIEQITPDILKGENKYQISEASNYAVHTYSNINTPPITNLIELSDHKIIRTVVANEELAEKINALNKMPIEFFEVEIEEGVKFDGWMFKPPEFDRSKKYPLLYYLYGHPADQTVKDSWSTRLNLWYLMLAQHGYLVVSVDNRGTPAPKGRNFRKHIYKDVGTLTSKDQADALKVLINDNDFIDPERIAVWGWSGGATSTLNLLFRYPDVFSMGMAVAPLTDDRFYDTIYSERYMGLLKENEASYINSSPITFTKNLKGRLLVVHGTGDDNVHYQNTEVLINELIKYNKPFTMMAYPNRSHSIYEGEGTTLHLYSLLTSYLETNLPAGGR